MASCGKCGAENKEGVKFCQSCGTSMAVTTSPAGACSSCDTPLASGQKFCRKCGATVTPRADPMPAATAAMPETDAPAETAIAPFSSDHVPTLPVKPPEPVPPADKVAQSPAPDFAALKCTSCAAPLLATARFCKSCGTAVIASNAAPAQLQEPTDSADDAASISPQQAEPTPADHAGDNLVHAAHTPEQAPQEVPQAQSQQPLPAQTDEPPQQAEPAAVAAAIPEAPPAPPIAPAIPETPTPSPSPMPNSSKRIPMLAAALSVLLISGAGIYWWTAKTPEATILPPNPPATAGAEVAPAATAPAIPAQDQAPVATAPAPANAAPVPARAARAAPATEARVVERKTASAPHTARPVSQLPQAQAPAELPDVMAKKVTTLLAKADGYIAARQYDKAIATAESVLELEPSSRAASAMISKAKARQMEALKSGSSID